MDTLPPALAAFACHHCGLLPLTPLTRRTLDRLAAVLAALPTGPTITSGYRCLWHNASTPGAAWNSAHQLGAAVDLAALPTEAPAIVRALRAAGFVAITHNHARGYVHAELRP